ncbi:cysteine--tRNA ligase [Alloalcanivorax gelatiniphagus]|uniref:Cysteine--tRNA ligase n=1 Tax=Alloalcanivorax gelatiniphagus TaxID=1194167 RepID=A0ABY2XKN1_9GAMM|nr:cysteine--tRNA ligase [Alloalcanivorax gelatiniphagus]TMW12606.1 cysteine--tRNA ligase [Alloalcanivorax gelatiniphagus]|tara:strand:- start:2617 stop:4002 length:1386 start_codon:yes stop_codon:yes gene_type:complete
MLTLHNTLTGQKDVFQPLDPERVTLYVCGPTVYNYVHIGNARPVVVFDVLYRLLARLYPKVVYARNITDIDDKIINACADSGETMEALTGRFTAAFREDMAALGALEPSITPLATDHIGDMIAMIETLISKGHAYESQGHVLFAVQSMPDYGKLSGRNLEDMLAGARVEVADYKRHPGDFVLWKPSSDDQPGWDSPWGRGRPGWHIECSAMIHRHLGDVIDIHGGGQDLIFPHHENEIAQGCCAHGTEYVRYWMHNGYINIDGEKMSKSLGNFRLVRDLLQHYPGEVLRFALLSSHYRSPLNFSVELLEQARSSLDSLYYALLGRGRIVRADPDYRLPDDHPVVTALLDDLNTSEAISALHAVAARLNKAEPDDKPALKAELLAGAGLLGLLDADPTGWFQNKQGGGEDDLDNATIDALVAERNQAKKDRDFARADDIRDQLKNAGIQLEDTREGTRWTRG